MNKLLYDTEIARGISVCRSNEAIVTFVLIMFSSNFSKLFYFFIAGILSKNKKEMNKTQ